MSDYRVPDYPRCLAALLTGDSVARSTIVQAWLDAAVLLPSLYEDRIQRALCDVGVLWERGRIIESVQGQPPRYPSAADEEAQK